MKIEDFNEIHKGKLLATFTAISAKDIKYRFVCLFHDPQKNNHWVMMPSKRVDDERGNAVYHPYVEFPKAFKGQFDQECLEALKLQGFI